MYSAVQLSTDHTCKEPEEVARVQDRSSDPNPIRRSVADIVSRCVCLFASLL